jgi:hypothetical protein
MTSPLLSCHFAQEIAIGFAPSPTLGMPSFDVSLFDTSLQYHDDCLDDLPSHIYLEDANFAKHQAGACRK